MDSSEDPWEYEEYVPPSKPAYYRKENGNFGVWGLWPESRLLEYPGNVRPGLVQSLCDTIFGRLKY